MKTAQQKLAAIGVRVETHHAYQKQRNGFMLTLEKFMYQHRNKLVFLHIFMFIFFMVLIITPLFLPQPMTGSTPFNNFTEFSLFLIWGLWFPVVFLSVIVSGRSWCGLFCPMGAASQWTNKVGLQRRVPAWLRWEGTPVLSFAHDLVSI